MYSAIKFILCISCAKSSFISMWIPMHAKLFYFHPTAVKYSVLTDSWALIALDNTACSTSLIFHTGTTWEKHARRSGWGMQPCRRFRRLFPFFAGRCREHPRCPQRSVHSCAPELRLWKHPAPCLERSGAILPAGQSWARGGVWLEISWAQSLCWGFETEQIVSFKH